MKVKDIREFIQKLPDDYDVHVQIRLPRDENGWCGKVYDTIHNGGEVAFINYSSKNMLAIGVCFEK